MELESKIQTLRGFLEGVNKKRDLVIRVGNEDNKDYITFGKTCYIEVENGKTAFRYKCYEIVSAPGSYMSPLDHFELRHNILMATYNLAEQLEHDGYNVKLKLRDKFISKNELEKTIEGYVATIERFKVKG